MSWRDTRVAADGSHHLIAGVPAYDERFDEVLKFHEPGLAPVLRGADAWHIYVDGTAAYSQRYQRTFGFYEGRAAVISGDGWHHITASGEALYTSRYAWCGNFQGGRCPVRERECAKPDGVGGGGEVGARYYHITKSGDPAYAARWRYAGDYRDGIAVVQSEIGLCTHIDEHGDLVHGHWFIDLDVFHKGYARARLSDGWAHVNRAGSPVYTRRFATIEPFYNGQARVEGFDGRLEVIAEDGVTVQVLRHRAPDDESGPASGDMFRARGGVC